MHFLIVDDDHAINKLMTAFFTKKGDRCSALSESTAAIEWLEKNLCDAVILDIGMPNIDGLSLIPMIREKRPRLPIIIFTGMGYDSKAMKAALDAGANGFVSKGMPPDEVYVALQRVLAARRS